MNVFIARDGAEIGDYPRAQLEDLARVGRLRPSDFYWYEGMDTWLLLGDLLGEEAWKPKRVSPIPKKKVQRVAPQSGRRPADVGEVIASIPAQISEQRNRLIWLGGGILAFVVVAATVVFFINSAHSTRPAVPPLLDFAKAGATPSPDPVSVRDQAAADLRQRIERLPDKPTPPRYTFYYDVSVNMRRSYADGTTWIAVIRGGENVVDPQTQATTMHTDFVLTAEYHEDEWLFQHYRASVSDIVNQVTTEIDDDQKAPAPPSIAAELGLKIRTE